MMHTEDPDLCIVGGGAAGMMAGLLFARAGVKTLVLEKHGDFLRDFRGDTVHPSTLDLFDELGLLDGLLARPHDEAPTITALVAGESLAVADFRHLPVRSRFIALMPQWEFLDYVAQAARTWPGFALRMQAEAVGVVLEQGRIAGVRAIIEGTEQVIRAKLVIAADGRRSILREAAALPLQDLGAPIDVFWFRLPKAKTADNRTTGIFATGRVLALIDRGDYWQCAYVFPKGSEAAVKARGIDAFRRDVAAAAPLLADTVAALAGWDEVKLLSVSLDRLTRWHRPGLLAIGDAAHAMSPVGGVGINLAIQDAVAAANILAAPLAMGRPVDALLGAVQRRRMLAVQVVQGLQRFIHARVIGSLLIDQMVLTRPPRLLALMQRWPVLQRIPAQILGMGVRREHIRSPAVPRSAA